MLGRYRTFRNAGLDLWLFALGYFVAYIPYVTLARAMTQGYLGRQPVSGFDILPVTMLGTTLTIPPLVALIGGFHFANVRRIACFDIPFPKLDTVISGIAFAVIIATTTMAYTFAGISIVLALVLMRGGVLVIAPVTDAVAGRRVDQYSWIAFALSLGAVALALLQVGTYTLTGPALVNLALYLSGYIVRLKMITRHAKDIDEAVNRRFLAEECIVAMTALVLAAAVILLVRGCSQAWTPERTFALLADGPVLASALFTGVAYGSFGICATLIYLHPLENTFAVPINRGASVLSGIVASMLLTWLCNEPPVKTATFVSASLIVLAGFILYLRSLRPSGAPVLKQARRFLLFVCNGNTDRSPMAQAICETEIIRQLAGCPARLSVQVGSAGLSVKAGSPMSEEAQRALSRLRVPVPAHASRNVTAELVDDATLIICMTRQQCNAVITINPAACGKVLRLHPFRDLDSPGGQGTDAVVKLSRQIQYLVVYRLSYFLLLGAGPLHARG
jgi:protein-tyrosine-phosphatase